MNKDKKNEKTKVDTKDELEKEQTSNEGINEGSSAGAEEQAEKNEEKDPLEELQRQLDESKDLLLRTVAEYDNYRKRTEREKQASIGYGMSAAIEKLLPALDALELAAFSETGDANYKKGVELTLSMFKGALTGLGVETIEPLGKPFDPETASAIAQVESDKYDSGCVAEVLQKGYKLGDRMIRHAMVSVVK